MKVLNCRYDWPLFRRRYLKQSGWSHFISWTCSGCKMDKAAVDHLQGLKELHERIQ